MTHTRPRHRADQETKLDILEELMWTPSICADDITVSVADGAVTLAGKVASYPEKEAAVAAALRVHGVTALADEIVVHHRRDARADADIARDASIALDQSVLVPGAVRARVAEHVVTLSGAVRWAYQREAARQAVATIAGVREVVNGITVETPSTASSAETERLVTAALLRHAALDAEAVTVAVHGQGITLTGTVSSLAQSREAENAAWFAPGVTSVVNHLYVDA